MKTLVIILGILAGGLLASGFIRLDAGENRSTVQSALGGAYYVRSDPTDDYGTEGKTQVFKVKSSGDELLDEYPFYMRGDLYLGWSPIAGKYCLVHVEPERILNNDDYRKMGKVSRLAFYMGGKEILTYTGAELAAMTLQRNVQTLVYRRPGEFIIHGIRQVPLTNHYVLEIERTSDPGRATEMISFDITTGKAFQHDPKTNAEPGNAAYPEPATGF